MYKDILLPIDLNEEHSWSKSLPTAITLCESFGARLHVMTVMPDYGMPMVSQYFPENYEAQLRETFHDNLEAFVSKHVPKTVQVQRILAEGRIYQEILNTAGEIEADLIVMASHHPEIADYLIGPNASKVVRHADCSVLVVRE